MSLTTEVFDLCKNLASRGWKRLFDAHGLNIVQTNPDAQKKALAAHLPQIDRTQPGFADFSPQGTRGIEPGSPARSLFFHALASPDVLTYGDGKRLRYFPTPAEIDLVENYIYGIAPPSLEKLQKLAGSGKLAIVVFSQEYRPARQTCHRRHADMVYSRTGVARVGTSGPVYRGDFAVHPRCCRRPVRHGSSAGSIRCLCCHTKARQRVGFPAIAVSRGS